MPQLIDTHAHYDDARFDGIRDDILNEIFSGDVKYIINAATNLNNAKTTLALAEEYPGMFAICGIHPCDCTDISEIDDTLSKVKEYLKHPKVVAIGEIGLDNHWPEPHADIQAKWFEAQMRLAEETGMPVVIHDREAHGACMDAILAFPKVRGVFHSFSGSPEMARELVRRGWYVSFSGTVTFKNAARVVEAAAAVPMDRILSETDCPYLAPHPHRGEMNHSGYMHLTVEKLAERKGVSYEEMCDAILGNAKTLFGIK